MKINLNDKYFLNINKGLYGYHYEVFLNEPYTFLFSTLITNDRIEKAAMCVGGAIYGYFSDDILAEVAIKAIEKQIDSLKTTNTKLPTPRII